MAQMPAGPSSQQVVLDLTALESRAIFFKLQNNLEEGSTDVVLCLQVSTGITCGPALCLMSLTMQMTHT